jgi:hypothetical protein
MCYVTVRTQLVTSSACASQSRYMSCPHRWLSHAGERIHCRQAGLRKLHYRIHRCWHAATKYKCWQVICVVPTARGLLQLRPFHTQMNDCISSSLACYEEVLWLRKYWTSRLLWIYAFSVTQQAKKCSFWNANCISTCRVICLQVCT